MNAPMTPLATTLAYHERTKHRLEAYAAGPEVLDWSAQPNPFREFVGAPRIELPFGADAVATRFDALRIPDAVAPAPMNLASLGVLFELSFAISAWKQYGPDRWALRCNPSSGNLHPTEAYAICRSISGIGDGVYHYLSRDHVLEQRCVLGNGDATSSLRIGLTSILWREAWKYGERAFRYCQHDIGHAIGALRYAAAALGWQVAIEDETSQADIAALLGADREADFGNAEREEAEVLLRVSASPPAAHGELPSGGDWRGHANLLDAHPMYRWPVIDEVCAATRKPRVASDVLNEVEALTASGSATCDLSAATLIRQRRSAQHFDPSGSLALDAFAHMAASLLPGSTVPWDLWPRVPRVHPVFFVHRIDGLASGIYALPRHAAAGEALRDALDARFTWEPVAECPGDLPLYRLAAGDAQKAMRVVSCHQAIASDSAFTLAMLAEFHVLHNAPWRYRELFWEAGLLGQVLYLEAEAAGARGTGIGCYFDDVCHELLGMRGERFQSFYHFTVGVPLTDTRILTLPPYPGRQGNCP